MKPKGVCYHIRTGSFQAYITHNGRKFHLGYYSMEKQALHARTIACMAAGVLLPWKPYVTTLTDEELQPILNNKNFVKAMKILKC